MEDSDHQPTHSGALIGSNDDLLTEILLRLPVTSILRFKSVSKHWRLLLRHRHFTHRYDTLLKSPGFFTTDNIYVPYDVENPTTPLFRSLDFYPDPRGIRIVQSCNGLLLCCTYRGSIDARKYYVFNPTTKQFAFVPCLPGGYEVRKTIRFMGLAFHRTDCVHYKLVCIRSLESDDDDDVELFQIQIYSSDTREWRICPVTFRTDCPVFDMGVYWNGAIHWAPSYRNHLYFKIDAEQLQTLPSPVEMTIFQTLTMYFGESRGHLHLTVLVDSDETGLHLNVYEMLGDHSGWFVKYQLQLHEIWGAFPEMTHSSYDFDVVDVVRGVKEEDTFIVLRIHGKLTRCRHNSESVVHENSYLSEFHHVLQALVLTNQLRWLRMHLERKWECCCFSHYRGGVVCR
ncbi:F-box protein At5g07610 isoform X1 [Helianthus annuus]|uniref:F-box protein At5g07610 isoform X1 n=1 Tax=Helianthus annuus TaxID=4232 RepID=UPI0016532A88|nr:F-box protein At5g07610 isoform X1 [Helianthus annuus]